MPFSVINVTTRDLIALKQYSGLLNQLPGKVKAKQGGHYLSQQKGRGMEFAESRPYETGDDIRNLDWRVMARTGKAHTKLFREERERPVFFLLDLRGTMFFATRGMLKSVLAARIAAILAWNAYSHSDRVGGIFFNDTEHDEVKPRRGKTGVLHFFNRLVSYCDKVPEAAIVHDEQAFKQAVLRLRRLVKPGSLIYVLSDFRNCDAFAQQQLMQLARHNDIKLFYVYDPLETQLPLSGQYTLCEGENVFQLNTANRSLLKKYHDRFKHQFETIQSLASKGRMGLVEARTDKHVVDTIKQGLK